MQHLYFNGKLMPAGEALVGADNRGFRYGDGLFETLKVSRGLIPLGEYHFERLFEGLSILGFEIPEGLHADALREAILELCARNGHLDAARVRMMFFRGDGGLHHPEGDRPSYIIQTAAWADREWALNEAGLRIGIFPDGRKSCDRFSAIKSNNYLLYGMAARYARSMGWDDCVVLNSRDRVADSTIANCWYVREGVIYTPSLEEGCVAGVMRRWLLRRLPEMGFRVVEGTVAVGDLFAAEEIFFSNALRGIQWVGGLADRVFPAVLTRRLTGDLYEPL